MMYDSIDFEEFEPSDSSETNIDMTDLSDDDLTFENFTEFEEVLEENAFQEEIEEMSLEDLNTERELLEQLENLDIEKLTMQFDEFQAEQEQEKIVDDLVEGLSVEQLEDVKLLLQNGDSEIQELFKGADSPDEGGPQKVLRW